MENEIIKIAIRFNFWIRHFGVWYTPTGFAWNDTSKVITQDQRLLYKLANPIDELDRGRWLIIQMVEKREDPEKIKQAIIKMGQFEKMIRREYKENGWTVDINNINVVLSEYYNNPELDNIKFLGHSNHNYEDKKH